MIKLLNVYLNHFPKHEKYALSNRIRNTAYQVFDNITEGHKLYHKKTTLRNLDIAHERLRMQLYLAHELGYFNYTGSKKDSKDGENGPRRYLAISKMIDELGRMIGAWIKVDNH